MADDKKEKAAPIPSPLEEACANACNHPKCHPNMAKAIMQIPARAAQIERKREAAKKSKK